MLKVTATYVVCFFGVLLLALFDGHYPLAVICLSLLFVTIFFSKTLKG